VGVDGGPKGLGIWVNYRLQFEPFKLSPTQSEGLSKKKTYSQSKSCGKCDSNSLQMDICRVCWESPQVLWKFDFNFHMILIGQRSVARWLEIMQMRNSFCLANELLSPWHLDFLRIIGQ